jgi:pimeloyl-ACP methyl ester carboxylesterase
MLLAASCSSDEDTSGDGGAEPTSQSTNTGSQTTSPDGDSVGTTAAHDETGPGDQADPRSEIPREANLVAGEADRAAGIGPSFDLEDPTAPDADAELKGEPGRLIKAEAVEESDGGTLWRIWYESSGVDDQPIMVSGLVAVPSGDAPDGGFPTISYAHGTAGIGDACAPSRSSTLNQAGGRQWAVTDTPAVIVDSDYEGLGTDGVHHYLVGVTEGRSVLDATRAATQISDADISNKTVIWGQSQGGHAALFAAELAASWAPELDVVGIVAESPATEMPLLGAAVQAGIGLHYLIMASIGYAEAYDLDLNQFVSETYWEAFDDMTFGCSEDFEAALEGLTYDDLATKSFSDLPDWSAALEENNPGTVKFDVPLLIAHGADDDLVPSLAPDALAKRMCDLGQVLEYRLFDGQGHGMKGEALDEVGAWIDARLAGDAMPTGTVDGATKAAKYGVCG